jgi:hypothetical protein
LYSGSRLNQLLQQRVPLVLSPLCASLKLGQEPLLEVGKFGILRIDLADEVAH